MKSNSRLFVLYAFTICSIEVQANVRLPALFSDHMVLQRDVKVPVWGWGDAGERVTVKIDDQAQTATADKNGKWIVRLAPLKTGDPHTLTVNGNNTLTVQDVLVGDVVATYVFWAHHEEEQGKFDWTGQRSLRRFLELCKEVGLKAIVRMGPWAHGECVNGGFPHWVSQKGHMRGGLGGEFMEWADDLFREEAKQMEGLLWKDGGPVIGVQMDNECPDPPYLLELKRLARSHGVDVPLYTMTGWNGVPIPPSGLLPVFGAYADGFWSGTPRDFWVFYVFTDVQ